MPAEGNGADQKGAAVAEHQGAVCAAADVAAAKNPVDGHRWFQGTFADIGGPEPFVVQGAPGFD